jgi:hypothetical protein
VLDEMSKIIYDVVRYLFSRYWPQSSKRPSGVSQNRKGRKITGRSGEAMEANNPNPQGNNPITETFSVSAQSTSTAGQGASTSYSVGASFTADAEVDFVVDFTGNIKTSDTITNTSKWSSIVNSATTKTASLSITGPAFTDNYTGPIQMQVWRDNIYGSFMFFPIN